jgi:hypothetical protein
MLVLILSGLALSVAVFALVGMLLQGGRIAALERCVIDVEALRSVTDRLSRALTVEDRRLDEIERDLVVRRDPVAAMSLPPRL